LILSLIIIFLEVATVTVLPTLYANISEALTNSMPFTSMYALLVVYTLNNVIAKTSTFLLDATFSPVVDIMIREMHYDLASHALTLSLNQNDLSPQEIVAMQKRIGPSIRGFMKPLTQTIIPSFFIVTILFYEVLRQNVMRHGLMLGMSLVLIFYYISLRAYIKRKTDTLDITNRVSGVIQENLQNSTDPGFNKKQALGKVYQAVHEEALSWRITTTRFNAMNILLGLFSGTMFSLCIAYASYDVSIGVMPHEDFIQLNGRLVALFAPTFTVLTSLRSIADGAINLTDVINFFHLPQGKIPQDKTQIPPRA
jgi:ABC-type multidrug transport system fused ATPase/permease subunit